MNSLGRLVLAAATLALSGCIVSFRYPLGPPTSGFIDQRLLGTWQCSGADDANPGLMTILDFDGEQYYVLWVHEGSAPSHSRAFATRLGGVPFLNLQGIGPDEDRQWMFATYVFADAEHLSLRMVDPQAFKEVIDNQGRVRRLLERRRNDPSIFVSLGSCARAPGAK